MKINKLAVFIIMCMCLVPLTANAQHDPYGVIKMIDYDEAQWTVRLSNGGVAFDTRSHDYHLRFKDVEFTDAPYGVELLSGTGSDYTNNNTVEIRLDSPDGEVLSKIFITEGNGWENPVSFVGTIDKKITGTHDIYISSNQPNDIVSITFLAKKKNEIIYTQYTKNEMFSDIAKSEYKNEIETVCGLGLMSSEKSFFEPDVPVKRGEFAKIVANILTDEIPLGADAVFNDVESDDENYDAINFLYQNNIITKGNDGCFYPWKLISVQDASVMLLRVLGYETIASHNGGYPAGYNKTAKDLGFYTKISFSDYLRRDVCAKLVYSAVFADYASVKNINNGNLVFEYKKGILAETRDILYNEGIVTANIYGSITMGDEARNGTVKIGYDDYFVGNTDASKLLGLKAEYFYKTDSRTKEKTLIFARASRDVKDICIDTTTGDMKITKIAKDQICYTDENGKIKNIKISLNADWVYNNRVMSEEGFLNLNNQDFSGRIRVINNGNGNKVVLIEKYQNIKIDSVNIPKQSVYDGLSKKEIDFSGCDLYIVSGGKAKTLQNLTKNQMGLLYYSDDKKTAVMLIGGSPVNGMIESIEKNKAVIGKNIYKFAKELPEIPDVGTSGIFYFNDYDEIIYFEKKNEDRLVGVISNIYKNDDGNAVFEIFDESKNKLTLKIGKFVFIDGAKMEDYDEIKSALQGLSMNTPVLYTLDSSGRLFVLDTVLDSIRNDKDTLTALNEYNASKKYGYRGVVSAFSSNDTFELLYPVYQDGCVITLGFYGDSERKLDIRKISSFSSEHQASYIFYSKERNCKITSIAYAPEYESRNSGKLAIVDSICTAVSSDGETVGLKITAFNNNSQAEYWIHPDNTEYFEKAKSLKKGDAIRAAYNYQGDLAYFSVICFADGSAVNSQGVTASLSINNGSVGSGGDLNDHYVIGKVKTIKDGFYEIEAFGSKKSYWFNVGNFVVNFVDGAENSRTLETGASSDMIKPGDILMVRINYSLDCIVLYNTDEMLSAIE